MNQIETEEDGDFLDDLEFQASPCLDVNISGGSFWCAPTDTNYILTAVGEEIFELIWYMEPRIAIGNTF